MISSLLRVALVVGLLVALVPGTASAQRSPTSRGADLVCPPPGMDPPSEPLFADTAGNTHRATIDCVAQYGIAQGTGGDRYRPEGTVSRGQMATFVRNLLETAFDEVLEGPGGSTFTDTSGTRHEESIEILASFEIVRGYSDGSYRPGAPVNRAQMATYLANAIDFVDDGELNHSVPPVAGRTWFSDTASNQHADNIDRLAEQGIVAGDGTGRYDPAAHVTRAQMATFVTQSGDYLAELGWWLWGPFVVTIDPEYASHLVGGTHAFTVTVAERDGQPMAGEPVEVLAFRFNTEEELPVGTATTGSDGTAAFEIAGPDVSDVDLLIACVPDCDDPDGVGGFAIALWAEQAVAGDTTTEDVVVDVDHDADTFDSLTLTQDQSYLVRRWAFDPSDTFREERSDAPSRGTISMEQFEDRLADLEDDVCVAVTSYDPAGRSEFALIDCETYGDAQHESAAFEASGSSVPGTSVFDR